MNNVLLEGSGISVNLGGKEILHGIDLTLNQGEARGLVGESGSGKTTLALAVIGQHRLTGGAIRYRGREISQLSGRDKKEFRRKAQYVFQDPYGSLDPMQKAISILEEPLRIHGLMNREMKQRALKILDQVGLGDWICDRYPGQLSGGQRQRLAIARSIILEPEMLIMDEPVAALDVSIQAQILNLLMEIQQRNSFATLFIAHDLHLIRHFCTSASIMYRGYIVEEGNVDVIFHTPSHPYTRMLLQSVLPGEPGKPVVTMDSKHVDADTPDTGCPFAGRCPVSGDICTQTMPEIESSVSGTFFRCHFPLK